MDGRVGDLLVVVAAATLAGGAGAASVFATIHTADAVIIGASAAVPAALLTAMLCFWILRRRHARSTEVLDDQVDRLNRTIDHDATRREFKVELDRALDLCVEEESVYKVVGSALTRMDGDRPTELHIVDPAGRELRLAVATGTAESAPAVTSAPSESLALRTGKTLVYESTSRLDACPHLRSRVTEQCSAVCIPLPSIDGPLGVLYATGPDGAKPTGTAVETMEYIVTRVAIRISLIRAIARSKESPGAPAAKSGPAANDTEPTGTAVEDPGPTERDHDDHEVIDLAPPNAAAGDEPAVAEPSAADLAAATRVRPPEPPVAPAPAIRDPVTKLPVHEWLYARLGGLHAASRPYAVAVLDLDDLRLYEERHGVPARDDAVRLTASVAEKSLRPCDHVGRIAMDQLMIVFDSISPQTAANAIERIRESLIIAQATHTLPGFRCSFGVAGSEPGSSVELVVESAQDSAAEARRIGGNRVVVSGDPQPQQSSDLR